jgi:hypothetical protein
MQSGALGQLLLGIAPLVAELPQPRAKSRLNASVVTSKPAIRGQFKTGQRNWPET